MTDPTRANPDDGAQVGPDGEPSDHSGTVARRTLLGAVGVATVGGLTAGVLGLTGRAAGPVRALASASPTHAPTHSIAAAASPSPTPMVDHDQQAEATVKKFPAKTTGLGLQELPSRVVNGTREFELSCQKVRWEVTPGVFVDGLSYNGQIPGPIIRVTEGERVRIRVKNDLDQTTGTHWHGQKLTNNMDGVPFLTQPTIKPGGSFTYEFVAKPSGSHMYHSHHNATEQVGHGMLGPLLVMPKDPTVDPKYDQDHVIIFNDQLGGFTLNGKGFPATAPYTAKVGERLRFRFMNEGQMIHPMHLHGMPFLVFARDGYPLPQPYLCDTVNVAPGERWDVIVVAEEPGAWAFHCHILGHAEVNTGMFGMVTALIIT
ncbi:MAG TPA: multicopper oxidase domain-containing protein [Candidatus Limnocylindria bacterium]|nr:multicopper oxidase domain-containing protein [Candidatus Limnocylindria bacterium]